MVRSSRLAHDGSTLLPDVTDPGVSRTPTAVPRPAVVTCTRTAATSSGPEARSARGNAERRSARFRHSGTGCSHAPRPGSRRRGSGVSTPCTTTTRNRSSAAARARHPTQVRTGPATDRESVAGVGGVEAEPEPRADSECSAASGCAPPALDVPAARPDRRGDRSAMPLSPPSPSPRPRRRRPYPERRRAGRRRCGCRSASR
jgi:hypothetical protein